MKRYNNYILLRLRGLPVVVHLHFLSKWALTMRNVRTASYVVKQDNCDLE